jgi:hypothetical protein
MDITQLFQITGIKYADLPQVDCKYGAPMGRSTSTGDSDTDATLTVLPVRLDDGGYDNGGAYWGLGEPIWHIKSDDGEFDFFRRCWEPQALLIPELAEDYPNATLVFDLRSEILRGMLELTAAEAWATQMEEAGHALYGEIMDQVPSEVFTDPAVMRWAAHTFPKVEAALGDLVVVMREYGYKDAYDFGTDLGFDLSGTGGGDLPRELAVKMPYGRLEELDNDYLEQD